jgi:hypothetical protein
MGTQYPTDRERRAIQASADKGDESARNYLELLDTCIHILEGSNGISLARGMVGEHNDVYGQAIDDALSELMPVLFRISAGGWDSLKWYVPQELQDQQAAQEPVQPTGSYEADQQRARQILAVNQQYLQKAMREAADSNDPEAETRVTLQYHEAMFKALQFLHTGTDCACQPDIDTLAATASKLDQERATYAASPATFGVEEMKTFIHTCITRLERVKNLCQVCHERMQYDMLLRFRNIHEATQVDPNFGRADWHYHPTGNEE